MAKLVEMYPDYDDQSGAVFTDIYNLYNGSEDMPEWLLNYAILDLQYIGNHSGEKNISPILRKYYIGNDGEKLTATQRQRVAQLIHTMFVEKWKRLYAVMMAEYNPIENYRMEETETPDISRKFSVSNDFEHKETKKTTTDYTTTASGNGKADVYGFNSVSPTPSNETATETETRVQGDGDDNVEENVETQTGYREETESGTRELERSGNIGVTTSQQMLESEIALWQWSFYDQVFADFDKVLALEIY